MSNDQSQVVTTQVRPRLLWGVSLVALLLLLWQIPWSSIAYRQVGTRAFLRAAFQNGPFAVSYRWPVSVPSSALPTAGAEDLETARWYLKQANGNPNRPPTTLNTYRTLGLVELAANNLVGAQQWLLGRLETVPDDVIARFFLGEMYLRQGDTAAAIEQWEAAGAKQQLLGLARDLLQQGLPPKALAALDAVMRLDAADEESRLLAAEVWLAQGQQERALALYQEVIATAPHKATGYILSGRVLSDQGQHGRAIMFFEQALQRHPESSRHILVWLGESYAALGQWAEAIAAYEQAIGEDPTAPGVYALMGEAKCRLGRLEEARANYEQAVALGHKSGRVRQAAEYIAQHNACPAE